MKPIGTITMDFAFIKPRTKKTLEEILTASKDYSDFTLLLYQKAVSISASDEIVILALRHLSNMRYSEHEWKILEIHKDRNVIRPVFLAKKASVDNDWETAIQVLQDAVEKSQSEWRSLLYLLKLYWIATTRKFGSSLEESIQEQIENAMMKNSKLQSYTAEFHLEQTIRLRQEGDFERSLDVCDKGITLADKYDDQLFAIRLMWQKAELVGIYLFGPGAITKAKQILIEATEIAVTINDPMGITRIQSLIQVMCHMRAEYSEAQEMNFDNLKRLELIGEQPEVEIHNISAMYNEMGNGKEALEWAIAAEKAARNTPLMHPYTIFDIAWSLISLKKLDDAAHYIDLGRESLLRVGIESMIAVEYMLNGLLEQVRGNYDSALDNLVTAMNVNRRNGRHNRVISCMIKLAETEVLAFQANSVNHDDDFSGKWLARLEKCGDEMDLPGVKGIVRYLRGALRLKQGRILEAQECIEEVLEMSKLPGLAFLREKELVRESSVPG
ncbi:MAG: hypothetical protein ACTSW8_05575 [Candidatus Thorarchaeota archaeon]